MIYVWQANFPNSNSQEIKKERMNRSYGEYELTIKKEEREQEKTMWGKVSFEKNRKSILSLFESAIAIGTNDKRLSEKEREYILYTNRVTCYLIIFETLLVFITMVFSRNTLLITTEILVPFATLFGQSLKWFRKIYLSTSFLLIVLVTAILILDREYSLSRGEEGGFFMYFFLVMFIVNMTLRYSNYSFFRKAMLYSYPVLGIIICFWGPPFTKDISTIFHLRLISMFFFNVLFVFSMLTFLLRAQIKLNNKLAKKIQSKRKKIMRIIESDELYALNAVIMAEEKEKRRFSEELHDSVGQLLATTKANLDLLTLEESTNENMKDTISNCMHLLKMAMSEVRNISHNLMPAILSDLGFYDAVNEMCKNARLRNGIKLVFYSERNIRHEFTPGYEASLHLYRIIQESVGNIIKHSAATEASIRIVKHCDKYILTISDNGCGFNNTTQMGNGLSNIRKRATSIGAKISIESKEGKGTQITITGTVERKVNEQVLQYGYTQN
jgi:signal transduction histidine kinase